MDDKQKSTRMAENFFLFLTLVTGLGYLGLKLELLRPTSDEVFRELSGMTVVSFILFIVFSAAFCVCRFLLRTKG